MTDKAKKVEVDESAKPSKAGLTVFTFPEYGLAVEAETIEEATKIAEKKAGDKE